jgi:hypothetical protein
MEAHFFDIESLIRLDNAVWIVSKKKPSVPIIKISKSEFNLIKKGIYKKYNSSLEINGEYYWLPENLYNNLKIKSKTMKFDITNLSFSLQEFMNPSLIENISYKILDHNFFHLKNRKDDLYVICSKKNKTSYKPIIEKLESELNKIGIKVKDYYYLSETFYNRDKDYISHVKVKLLIQHLLGFKTSDGVFTEDPVKEYNKVYFYDDDKKSINLSLESNNVLSYLLEDTDISIRNEISNKINKIGKAIIVREITHNKRNVFKENRVILKDSNLVKTFENFKLKIRK